MRADRRSQRKSSAQIRIKRACPRALQTFLENQLQRLVVARKRRSAIVGASHSFRRARLGAIGAQRASAVGADADGFGIVREAFHV